ncbi:hypothetical protein [Spiroplasma ixodetis]|uniref:hypothetical protein n=1 Tax=Spiroplasma ixodetis TaxID=2141 RepID=UPI0025759649|nr:hypothetical protein [Spiroplasma ixodetis]WJG69624.1 hypothetical protein SIXOD_v1c05340 [Spiroplasma ixodetis Y32]
MNNYLLSIDPSIKNTGFTLWEKKTSKDWKSIKDNTPYEYWKPLLVTSFNFKNFKKTNIVFELFMISHIEHFKNMDLIIERGTFHSKNGIGYETQEHLRGFIAGQFNKLLTKDMLISPSEWKKWYVKIFWYAKDKKWNKELSLKLAKQVIQEQDWNITISNHDEAEIVY